MVHGVVRESDLDESVVLGSVVADSQPERLEQGSEAVGGGVEEEVSSQHGQLIKEFDGTGFLEGVSFEVAEGLKLYSSFGFQLAEPVLDSGEDSPGRVVLGFEGADEAILTMSDVIDGPTQGITLHPQFLLRGARGMGLSDQGR